MVVSYSFIIGATSGEHQQVDAARYFERWLGPSRLPPSHNYFHPIIAAKLSPMPSRLSAHSAPLASGSRNRLQCSRSPLGKWQSWCVPHPRRIKDTLFPTGNVGAVIVCVKKFILGNKASPHTYLTTVLKSLTPFLATRIDENVAPAQVVIFRGFEGRCDNYHWIKKLPPRTYVYNAMCLLSG